MHPAVARGRREELPLRLNVSQPQSVIQNFWQRYASHAIAMPGACVANERDIDGSVAKLCFLIGRFILPVTPRESLERTDPKYTLPAHILFLETS